MADLIAAGEVNLGSGTVRDPVSKQFMSADDALVLGILPKDTWERMKALLNDQMITSGSLTIQVCGAHWVLIIEPCLCFDHLCTRVV